MKVWVEPIFRDERVLQAIIDFLEKLMSWEMRTAKENLGNTNLYWVLIRNKNMKPYCYEQMQCVSW